MNSELVLTGVYDVDVSNLISMLNDVKARLKSCSDTGAATQNFVQLWHQVNTLHNEINSVTDRIKAHEQSDEIMHTEQNERLEGLEQLSQGKAKVAVPDGLKEAAKAICEHARETVLSIYNTDTNVRTNLMAIGKEHVDKLKEVIAY